MDCFLIIWQYINYVGLSVFSFLSKKKNELRNQAVYGTYAVCLGGNIQTILKIMYLGFPVQKEHNTAHTNSLETECTSLW